MNQRAVGFIFAIISAVAWGTNGTFCALLGKFGLSTVEVAILAPMSNMLFFFFLLLFTNRTAMRISWKATGLLLLDGLLSSLVNVAFVKSVNYFPVGIVSTLIFCNVFTIMLLSRLVFKIKITAAKMISAFAAVIGVGMVLNVFSTGFSLNITGLLWVITAILCWSVMVTIEKYLLEQGVDGSAVLMYMGLFAVLILSISSPPWSLIRDVAAANRHTGSLALLTILGYGLIPQVLCYALYVKALKHLDPSYIQVAYSLDPVTASLLGFLIFGQKLLLTQVLGIFLIVAVVGYIQLRENREGAGELKT